jgi:hypothetical protein
MGITQRDNGRRALGGLFLGGVLVSASAAELNTLDGVTATTAELNILDQSVQQLTAGAGITDGTGTLHHTSVEKVGGIFKTTIFVDMTDLQSSTTDLDIIGTGVGNAHLGQITAALNGAIFFGQVTWLETPATGADDIIFYSADEATGAFDGGIAALTNDTVLLNKGSAALGAYATQIALAALPAADQHLYLVNGEAGTVGTYTAGQFIMELWGA